MKKLIFTCLVVSELSIAADLPPAPSPIFLKAGFSSVLEFDQAPTRVVLGDTRSFQVERVEQSLVVRTLVPYAVTNMFVYFRESDARLFVLTASEDAVPTYLQKFQIKPPAPPFVVNPASSSPTKAGVKILRKEWDTKKDYLVLGFEIAADKVEPIMPLWDRVRLKTTKGTISPLKLWSERKDIQKDSRVRVRLIFAKPNVTRDLKGVSLVIPLQGKANALSVAL